MKIFGKYLEGFERVPTRPELNLQSEPQERVGKMETSEGAHVSGGVDLNVEGEFVAAPNIFRLMKLVRETQCEMEVVKPVLDELGVMRLCRGFGMMASVNPKDFNFDVLHAREFDDDFIRFLRYELFENACPGGIQLNGLFGKQAQVANALVDMTACSIETVGSLAAVNEGVYCVKAAADYSDECSDTHKNDDGTSAGLVVFSWIRDEQFEPQRLRDTPTFILRFLTGLTPDIICCTTEADLEQIKAAMDSSDQRDDGELSLYSVSFHIEKQEDQPDATECIAVTSVDLETLPEDCSSICLLKGAYPAISLKRTMNSVIRTEQVRRTFHSNMQLTFAKWLKDESEHYRIDLSASVVRSIKLCQNILREFDMWPEDEVNVLRRAHEKEQEEEYEVVAKEFKATIAKQRAVVDQASTGLFQLCFIETNSERSGSSLQLAFEVYGAFREWIKSICTWQFDRKIELVLDVPTRLREIATALFDLHSYGHDEQVGVLLEMCATASQTDILKTMNKRRGCIKAKKQRPRTEKRSEDGGEQAATWDSFFEKFAEPLTALRTKWWLAVQSALAAVQDEELKKLKSEQKNKWYSREKEIREHQIGQLRKSLLAADGLLLTVSAHTRGRGVVHCEGIREVHAPPTDFLDIVKLDTNMREGQSENATVRLESLGRILLRPNESQVAMFTVKIRSAVQVCIGKERMCVKIIYFLPTSDSRRPQRANEQIIRTFGKFASLCDYDARNRIMTFLSEDSVGIYKFDEAFKHMELVKKIDLEVRSTLTELPFRDVLLQESAVVYVTDSAECSQAIDIHNEQTSNVFTVHTDSEVNGASSRLFELADNLAVGGVLFVSNNDGAFEGELQCITRDDHRQLPVLPLGVTFLTDRVSVQGVDDRVFVLDPLAQKVHVFSIRVTVRSDSYRMRQSDTGTKCSDTEVSNADCPRKRHWLYTFYHLFEKFPVRGLLDSPSLVPTSILIASSESGSGTSALGYCHDFFSLLMSDLMALNKPLYGLDLTKTLGVRCF